MNKLLALTNMEINRNSRIYGVYLSIVSSVLILLNIIQMDKFKNRPEIIQKIKESFNGVFYGVSIIYNNNYLSVFIQLSIGAIFVYSIYMWIREYTQKSIYTLKMIPANKFNIYLSKMITTILMIYGLLLCEVLILFISKNIFNIMFSSTEIVNTSLLEDLSYLNYSFYNIPSSFLDFFMSYGVWLVLGLSILFTFIVIMISLKNRNVFIKTISGGLYILIFEQFYGDVYSNYHYSNLWVGNLPDIAIDIIVNSVVILLLSCISHKLINKKLYA